MSYNNQWDHLRAVEQLIAFKEFDYFRSKIYLYSFFIFIVFSSNKSYVQGTLLGMLQWKIIQFFNVY